MRPKIVWFGGEKRPWNLLDVRLSPRAVYVQVWRVEFSWTFNPNRSLEF